MRAYDNLPDDHGRESSEDGDRPEFVWFHRRVWVPGGVHASGGKCFCEPVLRTRWETRVEGFSETVVALDEVN